MAMIGNMMTRPTVPTCHGAAIARDEKALQNFKEKHMPDVAEKESAERNKKASEGQGISAEAKQREYEAAQRRFAEAEAEEREQMRLAKERKLNNKKTERSQFFDEEAGDKKKKSGVMLLKKKARAKSRSPRREEKAVEKPDVEEKKPEAKTGPAIAGGWSDDSDSD